MYQGAVADVPSYFAARNHPSPDNYNPADWIMHVAQSVDVKQLDADGFFPEETQPFEEAFEEDESTVARDALGITICSRGVDYDERPVGMPTQVSWLFWREAVNFKRDTTALATKFGLTLFLGILIGVIFYDVGRTNNIKPSVSSCPCCFSGFLFTAQHLMFAFSSSEPYEPIRSLNYLPHDGNVWNSPRCASWLSSRTSCLSSRVFDQPLLGDLVFRFKVHSGGCRRYGTDSPFLAGHVLDDWLQPRLCLLCLCLLRTCIGQQCSCCHARELG